jgi:hypothetical protein
MWSSWVKTNDTTQVMHIAKLKDGPKRAMKLSQMILERVLKMVWWRGRKWTHVKRFWSWNVFLLSKYIDLTLGAFLFPSSFFNTFSLSFFNGPSLWGIGDFDNKWGEKHSSKISFQMKWNGMAKPWLWKWESCGYIGGGRIFRNGVMHTNTMGWG